MKEKRLRVAVVTSSDSGYRGEREDLSGPAIRELMEEEGYEVVLQKILPDNQAMLEEYLSSVADGDQADLILTTGGTGFSPKDVTPEATLAVCTRMAPGIPEAMRSASLAITPRAMLSRAAAGIREKTLIINLPGSPKAVRECLEVILPALEHGLRILREEEGNCARQE